MKPRRRNPDPLTKRERQVLTLVAQGYLSREIATRFKISAKTVEAHRTSLKRKLGLRRLAHLVRYAIEEGLVRD